MGRYIDPNSGRAPQPGGRSGPRSEGASVVSAPASDSISAASNRAKDEVRAKQGALEAKAEAQAQAQIEAEAEAEAEAEVGAEGDGDDGGEGEEKSSGDRLDDLTRDDLIEVATTYEVTGRHQMNRQDLIEAIRAAQ